MDTREARKLVYLLKRKPNLTDSQDVIYEALKFLAWTIKCQEGGKTLYLERNGCLEDILLLYKRSCSEMGFNVG